MSKKRTSKKPFLLDELKSAIRVPIVNQASDFTCGVAAMLSVLYYWDKKEHDYETNLAERLKANNKDGVVTTEIKRYARLRGFKVLRKEDMTLEEIEDFIRDGKPVIVLLQAWLDSKRGAWKKKWEDGHFAVAIGSDAHNIYFMDPSTLGNYTYIPKKEFVDRWHDWDGDKRVHHLGVVIWRERPSFDHRVVVKME